MNARGSEAALKVVRAYSASLKRLPSASVADAARIASEARELLVAATLAPSDAAFVEAVLREMLQVALDARERYEKPLRDANDAHARELARLKAEYARAGRKAAITALCVASSALLAFNGAAAWSLAPLLIVLYVWGYKRPLLLVLSRTNKTRR